MPKFNVFLIKPHTEKHTVEAADRREAILKAMNQVETSIEIELTGREQFGVRVEEITTVPLSPSRQFDTPSRPNTSQSG